LGAGANAGIGSMVDSSVDPENAIIAGWVNVITMGQGGKEPLGGMRQVVRWVTGSTTKILCLV
ncbi:adhesin, partial [Escherichia coli]|nr:adhesin [Escherichia coli]